MPNDCRHAEYAVLVLNSQNKEIYRGYTSDKGVAKFQVNAYDEYEVRVESKKNSSPKAAARWVHLCPDKTYGLNFIFNKDCFIRTVTIHLTDQYYVGLPISKGELFLWHM
jgi:hypothetical protein